MRLPALLTAAAVAATSISLAQQPQRPAASDAPLSKLLDERNQLLQERVDYVRAQYAHGVASLESVISAERALLESQLESATVATARIAIREAQLKLVDEREKRVERLVAEGLCPRSDLTTAKIDRLTAQINLLQETQRK